MHILSLNPPEGGRLYATAGLWDATQENGHGLEFVLYAPVTADEVHVETLTMVAHYHLRSALARRCSPRVWGVTW